MNMHRPPAEGNFCDKHEKAQKSVIVEGRHMGHKWDRMANSYSVI